MRFRPPVLQRRIVRARDLFRIDGADKAFWRRLRASYLSYISRHMPIAIVSTLANVAIWIVLFREFLPLYIWVLLAITQVASVVVWVMRSALWRFQPDAQGGTRQRLILSLLVQGFLGLLWGVAFYCLMGISDPTQQQILVMQGMIVLTIGAFINSIMPVGMIIFSAPVFLCLVAGTIASHSHHLLLQFALFVLYAFTLFRSTLVTATGYFSDIRNREKLVEQEEVLRLLLNEFETNGQEWLFEFDQHGSLLFASPRFEEATGRPIDEMIGKCWKEIVPNHNADCSFLESVSQKQPFRDEILSFRLNGEERWWMISGTPKFDTRGRMRGYRGVGLDITERQRANEQIAELANYDALTGVANRRLVHRELSDGLQRPEGVSLLFIDLDRFKSINDTLGHASGDQLLKDVSARLASVTEKRLGDRSLIGRLGGDEFAIILRSGDRAAAKALGEDIVEAISRPYELDGKRATVGASVGLAIGPQDGRTVEDLMRAADLALYDAKERGRGQVCLFSDELDRQATQDRLLEQALLQARGKGELRLVYQPIVNTLDERIVSFEALMRWSSPEFGEVPPTKFIPIAEETGLIGELGLWALDTACAVATCWPSGVGIAVNISPRQFDDSRFADQVSGILKKHGLEPGRLELELTETLFLAERPETLEMLEKLRALGLRFALDDFGTGYASLGYLHRIDFSRLKIDRSFISDLVSDGRKSSVVIVQAIVALAERLGMQTTAEGAETRAEFEAVRRIGCDQVQGYYFGKPMSREDAMRLVDRNGPLIELHDPSSTPRADNARWPAAAAESMLPLP